MRRDDLGEHLFAVLRRIIFLKDRGLTIQGVVASFLRDRIAPLQRRSHLAWEYSDSNDRTRLQTDPGSNLDGGALRTKLTVIFGDDPSDSIF